MFLKLMYITNDPQIALIAEKYGVNRIWIDLETLGKEERQKNMDTVKSNHTIGDIALIKPYLSTSELLVRVNPWNEDSPKEIEAVIDAGADIIMLPMWKDLRTVKKFINQVNGRKKTTLLLETKEAVECIDDILEYGKFDEIHIGLNDLHLSYGLTFMFELLANGIVEALCTRFERKGIPYGFGGIAKIGDGILPAEKIIMEHYRLGSSRAILSRSFCDNAVIEGVEEIDRIFDKNMHELRKFEATLENKKQEVFSKNSQEIKIIVDQIVGQKKGN